MKSGKKHKFAKLTRLKQYKPKFVKIFWKQVYFNITKIMLILKHL